MGKPKKIEGNNENPDVLERKRLKKLAISNNMVSDTPVKPTYSLNPSKTVVKHHGKDIIRKSQRKNRYLFSFPGLLGPISGGGKIGELKDLSSKNPVLYLHFPQGQVKLFGTIVYPKNRYLTLQFSRGGKNVMCEDYFDHLIVFSDAWWIGTKEENPEEAKLDFPKEVLEGKGVECDFEGGAGAGGSVNKQIVQRSGRTKHLKEDSLSETELVDDLSDDKNDLKDLTEATSVRHSARTAGRTFKFAEVSSGDDSVESIGDDSKEDEEEDDDEKKVKTDTSAAAVLDIDDDEGSREGIHSSEQHQASAAPGAKSKTLHKSAVSVATSTENSCNNHGSLVQSTISTLFKKVQEKKKVEEEEAPRNSRKSSLSKGQKPQKTDLKRKIDLAEGPRKREKLTGENKAGKGTKAKEKVYEDTEGSDEDWAA